MPGVQPVTVESRAGIQSRGLGYEPSWSSDMAAIRRARAGQGADGRRMGAGWAQDGCRARVALPAEAYPSRLTMA